MKRLLFVAIALLCACVFAVPVSGQSVPATASLPNYAGATITATSLTNAAHSTTATIAVNGGIALTLYMGDSYTFSVSAISSTYPAFTTARTQLYSGPYRNVDISQALLAGAAAVYVAPSQGSASVTASSVASAIASQSGCTTAGNVWQPATNTCVAAPAAVVTDSSLTGRNPALGVVTTQKVNGTMLADQAQTGSGNNGIDNLVSSSTCAAGTAGVRCRILIPPFYTGEFSHYMSVAVAGNEEAYQMFPVAGGISRPLYSEDQGNGHSYHSSVNPLPLNRYLLYNQRAAFVFETRFSNRINSSDNYSGAIIRQRLHGAGHNYGAIGGAPSQKSNWGTLFLDAVVHSANQGGGALDMSALHTTHGDNMLITALGESMGCSEPEDECSKLFRANLYTQTDRFGGTLSAAPTPDSGFGNYTFSVTVGSGYNAKKAGEDLFFVNLARSYTAGNIANITYSSYPGLVKIAGDATANWASQFGASVMTQLTAPIDTQHYNTACPSTVTDSSPIDPDPLIVNEAGAGGITGFCATVASTAGMSGLVGKPVTIAGLHSNIEIGKLTAVVDATHIRVNVQAPHEIGETVSVGGAQGYGIRKTQDDIPVNGLPLYATQPKTVLHKYFPIVGSDSSGNLYAYNSMARVGEMSSTTYAANSPATPAAVSLTNGSGGITAISVTNDANYSAYVPNVVGGGQTVLAVPTLTIAGCSVPPTYTAAMTYTSNRWVPVWTVTAPGTCSSPTVTVQSVYPIPYAISPLTMTKKVLDPATGSDTNGVLITGNIDPTKWLSGDLAEIEAWIHDASGSTRNIGKYITGDSIAGIVDQLFFTGVWTGSSTLSGIVNQSPGSTYFETPSSPRGPGVAYATPPSGFAYAGAYSIDTPIYVPPTDSVVDIGCNPSPYGTNTHPCANGVLMAYNFFHPHSNIAGAGFDFHLRFDPSVKGGTLSWDGETNLPKLSFVPTFNNNLPFCDANHNLTLSAIFGQYGASDAMYWCGLDGASGNYQQTKVTPAEYWSHDFVNGGNTTYLHMDVATSTIWVGGSGTLTIAAGSQTINHNGICVAFQHNYTGTINLAWPGNFHGAAASLPAPGTANFSQQCFSYIPDNNGQFYAQAPLYSFN